MEDELLQSDTYLTMLACEEILSRDRDLPDGDVWDDF